MSGSPKRPVPAFEVDDSGGRPVLRGVLDIDTLADAVRVDVALRKNTPVKTDTRASLSLKGITGVVYIELTGGSPEAKPLVTATAEGSVPEIPYEKSRIATVVEQLPRVIAKLSALEDKANKVVSDVAGVTSRIKEDPSLLLRPPKDNSAGIASAQAPSHRSHGPK